MLFLCQLKKTNPTFLSNITYKMYNFNEKISKLHNVKMVDAPILKHLYVEKGEAKSVHIQVSDIQLDTLKYLLNNQNDMFYIHEISPISARWAQRKDEALIENRKRKLEKLNNYEKL